MDRKQVADKILLALSAGAANQAGREIIKEISEQVRAYFTSGPSSPQIYETIFGGVRFRVSPEQFVRHEIPKNIEYLYNLPSDRFHSLVQQAQNTETNNPEEILMNLIAIIQEERIRDVEKRKRT
jgi:hypothetical protein